MFNSKDFLTLYLNGDYFFEKPPLYFWGECLSFALFGKVNEFTARFPVALYGASCCYLLYFIGKKIVSRFYGIVASLILATSLDFIILAKFAILDIVVSTCIAFSLCFGIIVYFCRESHKKYYWWLFYIFSALAVMAKGIPGFVVPFGSMFFIAIVSKKFKEIFKPQYFLVGMTLFLLIVLPWHIISCLRQKFVLRMEKFVFLWTKNAKNFFIIFTILNIKKVRQKLIFRRIRIYVQYVEKSKIEYWVSTPIFYLPLGEGGIST